MYKEYYIKSIYNTPDFEESEGFNQIQNIIVNYKSGNVILDVYEQHLYINDNTGEKEYSEISHYTLTIDHDEPIWELCYEDIERCYAAFHAYAVGCDGSHLNYMNVELVDNKECLELVS